MTYILTRPESLALLGARAKELAPSFPQQGDGVFLWLILEYARLLVPYGYTGPQLAAVMLYPAAMAPLLINQRWRAAPASQFEPRLGDLWVRAEQRDGRQVPAEVGFVVTATNEAFQSVEAACALQEYRPVTRRISQVSYWLTFG